MRELYQAFPHARRFSRQKGFTLIELLVVIAIIAILAAIAIPQFAKYRMRAFNSAAESDLRNLATAEEALFADNMIYGITEANNTLPGSGSTGGNGAVVLGPSPAATETQQGALITATIPGANQNVGIGIAVSNNVDIQANTPSNDLSNYVAFAHHNQGDTVYGKDSDSTAIYRCQAEAFAGDTPGQLPGNVTYPSPQPNVDDFSGVQCGGTIGWIAQ